MQGSDVKLVVAIIFGVGYIVAIGALVRLGIIGLRGGPVVMFRRSDGAMETGFAARVMGGVYLLMALGLLYPIVRGFAHHTLGT